MRNYSTFALLTNFLKMFESSFKKIYLATIVISFLGFLFLLFFAKPVIYWLYGYNPSLIGTAEFEMFQAAKTTYLARVTTAYFIWGTTTICFLLSSLAIYRQTFSIYFNLIILILSLLIISLFTIATQIPTRVF